MIIHAEYMLPHLEHWGQRDSLGSSTGLLGASTRSLHQCLQALWSKTQHVSYTKWPQEGPLPLSFKTFHALWQIHYSCTTSWLQVRLCGWKHPVIYLQYFSGTKQKLNKRITAKTIHCSGKSPCRSHVSQGDPYIVHLMKGNTFLSKSRCYSIKFAGENPTQTHSCEAPTCL